MFTNRKPMLSKTRSRKGRRPARQRQRLIDPRPRQQRQSAHLQHTHHLEPPVDNLRATPPIAAPRHNLPGERNPTFQGLTSIRQPWIAPPGQPTPSSHAAQALPLRSPRACERPQAAPLRESPSSAGRDRQTRRVESAGPRRPAVQAPLEPQRASSAAAPWAWTKLCRPLASAYTNLPRRIVPSRHLPLARD
jgi:hypothetical protein